MPRTFPARHFAQSERKPEAVFRSQCLKWLKLRFGIRFWHVKILGGLGQRSGIPDDLCCIKGSNGVGYFYAFEWKDPSKKPRIGPRQIEEIEAIRLAGGRAFIIHSFDDLTKAVSDMEPMQASIEDSNAK
jgi:hypothetical protein